MLRVDRVISIRKRGRRREKTKRNRRPSLSVNTMGGGKIKPIVLYLSNVDQQAVCKTWEPRHGCTRPIPLQVTWMRASTFSCDWPKRVWLVCSTDRLGRVNQSGGQVIYRPMEHWTNQIVGLGFMAWLHLLSEPCQMNGLCGSLSSWCSDFSDDLCEFPIDGVS